MAIDAETAAPNDAGTTPSSPLGGDEESPN
jgi:hypothetical protein